MPDIPLETKPETSQIAQPKPVGDVGKPMTAKQASQADLIAKRNALVKELFRTTKELHPPRPTQPSTPNIPRTPATTLPKKDIKDWDRGIAPQEQPKTVSKEKTNPEQTTLDDAEHARRLHSINGVHLDLYEYFSIDVNTNNLENLRRLQFINSWVATEGQTYNDGLRRLHKIDRQLGSADTGEAKLVKLYNWIRFSSRGK